MRQQFHHVIDIAPTIYDILDIPEPKVVNGYEQMPIDGVSLAYTFGDAAAKPQKNDPVLRQQRQPRHLPRRLVCGGQGTVHSVGYAGLGQAPGQLGFRQRTSGSSTTSVRTSRRPTISPTKNPEKLEELKKRFLEVAEDNKDFPIGAGNWLRLHPEDRVKTAYNELDLRPEHAPHAGIRRARRRAAEHQCDDRRRIRRKRQRRALRGRRLGRRPVASTWTTASWSTNTT